MGRFNLKFLNADSNGSVPYLPFGVTTIEMSLEGDIKAGYIRPANSSLGGRDKMYVGFPDSTNDILIIWGAGKEQGQYIGPYTSGRMFLQMLHLRGVHEKESVTFNHTADILWEQKLPVVRAYTGMDVVKMRLDRVQNDLRIIRFEGTKMPIYYPRWFPPKPTKGEKIQYVEEWYPELTVEFEENDRSLYSPIRIYLHKNGSKKKICNIEGDLMYSWPHVELFSLLPDEGIMVLRVWLYWIHKRFIGNVLYSFELTDKSEKGGYRKIGQDSMVEIPDIERFDFVLDTKKEKITWFSADFHYQEHWGRVKGEVVEARIAGGLDLVQETLERLRDRFEAREHYNPVETLKEVLMDEGKAESMSYDTVTDMAVNQVVERVRQQRAMFNIRTHVPYVKNGEIAAELVSSVVTG